MFGFFSTPRVGDVVSTTDSVYPSILGTPLETGTKGVVTDVQGSRYTVLFDTGFGTTETTVKSSRIRLQRRGVGADSFAKTAELRLYVRIGALITLAIPMIIYLVQYWMAYGTFNNLLPNLVMAALDGIAASIIAAINNPAGFLLAALVGAVVWWLAFGFPSLDRRARKQ